MCSLRTLVDGGKWLTGLHSAFNCSRTWSEPAQWLPAHTLSPRVGTQVRQEAIAIKDLVILPNILDHYDNQSHQTLEICRMAAADPAVTHIVKVRVGRAMPADIKHAGGRASRGE